MLTRPQIILIKRAQREAGLDDAAYRAALRDELHLGVSSSKDPALGQKEFDLIMAYFEAIYWKGSAIVPIANERVSREKSVFRQRGYWAGKNFGGETSRERHRARPVADEIATIERELADLGFGAAYCQKIRDRVTRGIAGARAMQKYCAAIARTLRFKRKLANEPF